SRRRRRGRDRRRAGGGQGAWPACRRRCGCRRGAHRARPPTRRRWAPRTRRRRPERRRAARPRTRLARACVLPAGAPAAGVRRPGGGTGVLELGAARFAVGREVEAAGVAALDEQAADVAPADADVGEEAPEAIATLDVVAELDLLALDEALVQLEGL